jgi:beta-glucanase (GH16 family)
MEIVLLFLAIASMGVVLIAFYIWATMESNEIPTTKPTDTAKSDPKTTTRKPEKTETIKRTTLVTQPMVKGSRKLVWSDEFNTNGAPDPTKWTYELGKIRNNELQTYTNRRENARVENGNMVIEVRNESNGYTSASVISKGRFAFTYGRLEVRAKWPNVRGLWPAIWLLPEDDGKWPINGEIDIMESVGYDPNVVHASIHTANKNGQNKNRQGATAYTQVNNTEFHVYALEWTAQKMDFFVDDRMYFSYKNPGTGFNDWPFSNQKFYILCNIAWGGSWGQVQGIDPSKLPAQMHIDYVRVYQ